jgi:hypothetical protein
MQVRLYATVGSIGKRTWGLQACEWRQNQSYEHEQGQQAQETPHRFALDSLDVAVLPLMTDYSLTEGAVVMERICVHTHMRVCVVDNRHMHR